MISLRKFGRPIFITENGVADKSDSLRAQFILDHLQRIRRCLDEKLEVLGYLHWSLMDNYEWHESYRPEGKFGLFLINREVLGDPKITKGANVLKWVIEKSFLEDKSGQVSERALLEVQEKYNLRASGS